MSTQRQTDAGRQRRPTLHVSRCVVRESMRANLSHPAGRSKYVSKSKREIETKRNSKNLWFIMFSASVKRQIRTNERTARIAALLLVEGECLKEWNELFHYAWTKIKLIYNGSNNAFNWFGWRIEIFFFIFVSLHKEVTSQHSTTQHHQSAGNRIDAEGEFIVIGWWIGNWISINGFWMKTQRKGVWTTTRELSWKWKSSKT